MIRNSLALIVASLLCGAMTSALAANTFVNNVTGWRESQPLAINPVGYVRATSETSLGANGLTGYVSVGGLSEFGVAKAYAVGAREGFYGLSQAGWLDSITIDGGSLNGQAGVLSIAVGYDWRLEYNPLAPIQMTGSIHVGLGSARVAVGQSPTVDCSPGQGCATYSAERLSLFSTGGAQVRTAGSISADGATGTAFIDLPFIFGQASLLQLSISAVTGSHVGSSDLSVSAGSVFADHSLNWGGIVAVKDSAGQAVAYNATSTSAFDYTQPVTTPVPEPGSLGLMAAGLLVVAGWRRRRR